MNKRNKPGSKPLLERKGFYTALYACIAVVLVMAVGITYSSLSDFGEPLPERYSSQAQADNPLDGISKGAGGAVVVEEGDIESILPASRGLDKPVSQGSAQNGEEITGADSPAGESPTGEAQAIEATTVETPKATVASETAGLTAGDESVPVSANTQEPLGAATAEEEAAALQAQSGLIPDNSGGYVERPADTQADPVFNIYTGNDDMLWPVDGEVVMAFSVDKLVYDKTLDQYRTNDNVCIDAEVGSEVKAAADGVVKSIENSRELGNTVVVEHGNGWFTTYSQLQDSPPVSAGDVVTAGQVIGKVSEPSIFSTLLGSHLSFKVTKDDAPVDPNLVLAFSR